MALISPSTPAPGSRLERLKAQPRRPGEASFFFFDAHFKNDAVKILPGEYFVHNEDMLIMTTLGSCIAACLYDRNARVGGMNHFMLPEEGKLVGSHGNISAGGRYGVHAMELLINQILKLGGRRDRLEAKVFGGGNVLQGFMLSNVGQQNAEFIVEYLNIERIPIVARDLLDVWPRKIYYFPRSGKVMVKRLRKVNNDTIVLRERDYGARLFHGPIEGGAELFK
jgi:chemotaxis protein CheD